VKHRMRLSSAAITIGLIAIAAHAQSGNLKDQKAAFDDVEAAHSRTEGDAQVTVSVYNDAQVPSDTLRRAEQQAARIFLTRWSWRDLAWVFRHEQQRCGATTCGAINAPRHLALRIIVPIASSMSDHRVRRRLSGA